MDGLSSNLENPIDWAAETILSGIVEMGQTCDISEVEAIFFENKDFLQAAFEEEGIPMPSDTEIIKAAKEYLMQYLDDT